MSALPGEPADGVVFPLSVDGRRSTSALGRAVVADALRPVEPASAAGAEQEPNWRSGYLAHFRRLVEAGLASNAAALSIAQAGLGSLHDRMRVAWPAAAETGLAALQSVPAQARFATVSVPGTGQPESGLSLPHHGEQLRDGSLARQLDSWVTAGIIEPSCADAVREVAAHPEWLPLPGQTVVALGAGAEVGPVTPLLAWGARVAAIDLPSPQLWERVLGLARRGAGTLLVPVRQGAEQPPPAMTIRRSPAGRASTWPGRSPMRPAGWPAWTARLSLATMSMPTARRMWRCPRRPTR